jgi:hypothetical protein
MGTKRQSRTPPELSHGNWAPRMSVPGPACVKTRKLRLAVEVGNDEAILCPDCLHQTTNAQNADYRWFCRLGIEDAIPDHSAFSRARNERFREGDVFRRVFERVVETCIGAGLVGGEGFAVDASLIQADANKQRSIAGQDWRSDRDPARSSRAVKEFDMTRPTTSTIARTESGLGRAAPCTRANRML